MSTKNETILSLSRTIEELRRENQYLQSRLNTANREVHKLSLELQEAKTNERLAARSSNHSPRMYLAQDKEQLVQVLSPVENNIERIKLLRLLTGEPLGKCKDWCDLNMPKKESKQYFDLEKDAKHLFDTLVNRYRQRGFTKESAIKNLQEMTGCSYQICDEWYEKHYWDMRKSASLIGIE